MSVAAGRVASIGPEGVRVLVDSIDPSHTLGPMESLVSGLVEGSRVLIMDRDDVPGTWVVAGEFANLPAPTTSPRSSTITVRWGTRKLVNELLNVRWRVATPSSSAVSDTHDTRRKVRRRLSDTVDARWRVLGAAADLGWDTRSYMALPGGQKILLGPGNYHNGKMPKLAGSPLEHPRNPALAYNGRLRIAAAIPGTVNVYCDPTGGGRFNFTDPDKGGGLGWGWDSYYDDQGWGELGVTFEDINFVNGATIFTGTSGFDFINCTWTNPPNLWKQKFDTICQIRGVPVVAAIPNTGQYRAIFDDSLWKGAGAGGLRLQRIASWNPWTNTAVPHGGTPPSRIRVISADQHDCFDDPLFWGGATHCKTRGLRQWNIGEGGAYYGEGPRAWVHPDVLGQYIGEEDDIDSEASEVYGHLEIVAETPGNITRLRVVKTRQLASVTASVGAFPFRNLSGLIDEFVWGANNVTATNGDYEYAEARPWYPRPGTGDYQPIDLQYTYPPDGVHMRHLTKGDLAALGYTMGGFQGRQIVDLNQPLNDPNNFANQWRAANPTSTEAGKLAAVAALGGWAWNPA